jgi:small subunit ribosomal protein S16
MTNYFLFFSNIGFFMVKLRLRRKGRKHHAVYDVVAMDSRARRDGDFLERLGFYDPNTKPNTIKIDVDRAIYWLGVGAQPTHVVNLLFAQEGILLRRHLMFKEKSAEEIETEVAKHQKVALDRYFRRKELRAKRKETKAKAEAEAKESK